ncbi:MAG: secretin N-terminal domain-containing protein [Betaproteobacteria bacterium]
MALAGCGAQPVAKSENHIQPETRTVASIPEPVRAIPLPPPPEARDNEVRYSVVVADQPVREVLMAMARETKINFDIDPRVEGTVNLNAIDQTLKQILNRMAKQVDMRWETDGHTITVMRDTPFLRNYRVDYVNMARDTSETVGIATQVISGSLTGTAGGAAPTVGGSNNSTLTITSTSRNRFWETLERNIKDMLRETDKLLPEGSSETFVQSRGQSALATSQARTSAPRRTPGTAAGARSTTEGPGETQQASDAERVEQRLTFREAASVIVNPETGIVSVRATSRQHEKVREFLEQITGASKRQVVIEATVVEVNLNDNYQAGVDWASLGLNGLGYSIQQNFGNPSLPTTPGALATSFLSIHYDNPNASIGGHISSTIKLLESFGKTRVLSSPKLMVLNNQTAMLKVVDNRVYFSVQATTSQNQTSSITTFSTTQNVVPIGFIMNVTPQISDADMVTLNVRPTVTRILTTVSDPNPDLARAGVRSDIPVTQTREMESVLKVASGQTAILGGLMVDSFEARRDGLPIASRIPLFGDLVSAKNELAQKSELVIFIRPIVVRDASVEGDLAAYRRYVPGDRFFRDTQPPFPKIEERVRRLENARSPFPDVEVKTVPVVPDAPPPEQR